jgi:hypothetical protein
MSLVIREAHPEDAAALVAYLQTLNSETNIYIISSPGEFKLTEAEEEAFLLKLAAEDNSVLLVADAGGQIAGSLILRGGESAPLPPKLQSSLLHGFSSYMDGSPS